MFDTTRQNIRYAVRALARSPLYATVAVLSITIGVGATTAIVTVANAALLRSAPGVAHPEGVVAIGRTQDGSGFDNLSYPNFLDYQAAAKTLSDMAFVCNPRPLSLAGPDGGEPIQGSIVSGNFFRLLGVRPAAGRFFLPEEDRVPGAIPVVVLSYSFWRTHFQAADSVVGSTMVLNGTPFTIVGVAAEQFRGPFLIASDVWVPVMASTLVGLPAGMLTNRQGVWGIAMGRLAPSTGATAAQSDLGAIAARLEREFPVVNRGQGIRVTPASLIPGDERAAVAGFLALLLAVSGLVLLIASTNVAGMLLARAAARQREIAVRLALGASRARLVHQLVTEGLLLFALAGATGVLLAHWLVLALLTLIPRLPAQLAFDPRMDWRVLGFALGASLLTGLVAGTVPALQSTRPQLVPALKNDTAGGGATLRLRSTLLTAQIAFSMLLLVVAALCARALARARDIDPGFDARGVELVSLDLDLANYDAERGGRLAATLLERARVLPGVRSAALTAVLPLGGSGLGFGDLVAAGRTPQDAVPGGDADWDVVTPGYFATLGIPLRQGRDFSEADRAGAPAVAILNETLARHFWPGQSPLGRTIQNEDHILTVVGVARDAKYRSLAEAPRNFIYVPLAQRYLGRTTLLVKTDQGVTLTRPIRQLVASLDRSLPILDQETLAEQAVVSLFPQRLALYVAGGLGGVALFLAVLGIYGVAAYGVARRTREIGVRIALGAQRSSIVGLVLRQTLVLAGLGASAGWVAAFGVTRLMRRLLYGIPATDPVAFGAAAALLILAALLASAIPARQAAKLDPVNALRSE